MTRVESVWKESRVVSNQSVSRAMISSLFGFSFRRGVLDRGLGAVHPGFGAQEVLLGFTNGAEHEFETSVRLGLTGCSPARSLADLQELPLFKGHRFVDTIEGVVDLQLLLDAIRRITEIFGGGFHGQ